jgi:sugar phosphate isomerase/epimerase
MPSEWPALPRSWKKRYAFRTGTTSFIYPAGYTENVTRLGPYLDEIELLMFESFPDSRPTAALVQDLSRLGRQHDLRYNIHLPTDLELTHMDGAVRRRSCRIMQDFIARLTPLAPSVYVLHLHPPADIAAAKTLQDWQHVAGETLEKLLQAGIPGRQLALENLFFPFDWLAPLIEAYDLSVCLDTGHLALQNGDLATFLATYADRIAIGHLHGLNGHQDHGPLTGLPDGYRRALVGWLRHFSGTVSLEVFAYEPLLASLACLDELMGTRG